MQYGTYVFSPVPLLNIAHDIKRTADGTRIGSVVKVDINGTLTPLPANTTGGLTALDTLQDSLVSALSLDGKLFLLQCGSDTLISGYPRVAAGPTLKESTDNWVFTTPYAFSLEFEGTGTDDHHLEDMSEEWAFEFMQDRAYFDVALSSVSNQVAGYSYVNDTSPAIAKLNHKLSAKGRTYYSTTGSISQYGWEVARDNLMPRMGAKAGFVMNSGTINWFPDNIPYQLKNHVRNIKANELAGTYEIDETWLVLTTGVNISQYAIEDFTVTTKSSTQSAIVSVSVEGRIEGL
jgi:hypothetical protein